VRKKRNASQLQASHTLYPVSFKPTTTLDVLESSRSTTHSCMHFRLEFQVCDGICTLDVRMAHLKGSESTDVSTRGEGGRLTTGPNAGNGRKAKKPKSRGQCGSFGGSHQ
jgi:hypothetical protein